MGVETKAVRILPLGDAALTVEFGSGIDAAVQARVAALAAAVESGRASDEAPFSAIVDVVATFRSLTVHFAPADAAGLAPALARLAEAARGTATAGRRWRLPAAFDPDFAPDLDGLAERAGLARRAVIDLFLGARFRVAMIGFMPGFPYMSGVPAALAAPRLASPRTAVPPRSIAITGEMCAVYPWRSPGGWRLVGSTPIDLFDAAAAEPSLLAANDTVEWVEVSADDHARIAADLAAGRMSRNDFRVVEISA